MMRCIRRLFKPGMISVFPLLALFTLISPVVAFDQFINISSRHGQISAMVHQEDEPLTPPTASSGNNTAIDAGARFPDESTLVITTALDAEGNFESYSLVGEAPAVKQSIRFNSESASLTAGRRISFTLESPFTLNQTIGYASDNIASGADFANSPNITVYFDNRKTHDDATNGNGSFIRAKITVLSDSNGSLTFQTIGVNDDQPSTESGAKQRLVLSSTAGFIVDEITIGSNGSVPGKEVTVTYGSEVVAANATFDAFPVAEAVAEDGGNLEARFFVPANSSGNHTVTIADGTYSAKHSFNLVQVATDGDANLSVGYGAGSEGSSIRVGFTPGRTGAVSYSTTLLTAARIDGEGNFTATFKAPGASSGEQNMPAADDGVTYTLQIAAGTGLDSSNSRSLLPEESRLAATGVSDNTSGAANHPDTQENLENVRASDRSTEQTTSTWKLVKSTWSLYSVIVEGGVFVGIFGFWYAKKRTSKKDSS